MHNYEADFEWSPGIRAFTARRQQRARRCSLLRGRRTQVLSLLSAEPWKLAAPGVRSDDIFLSTTGTRDVSVLRCTLRTATCVRIFGDDGGRNSSSHSQLALDAAHRFRGASLNGQWAAFAVVGEASGRAAPGGFSVGTLQDGNMRRERRWLETCFEPECVSVDESGSIIGAGAGIAVWQSSRQEPVFFSDCCDARRPLKSPVVTVEQRVRAWQRGVFVGHLNGDISWLDGRGRRLLLRWCSTRGRVTGLQSAAGPLLIVGRAEGEVELWDTRRPTVPVKQGAPWGVCTGAQVYKEQATVAGGPGAGTSSSSSSGGTMVLGQFACSPDAEFLMVRQHGGGGVLNLYGLSCVAPTYVRASHGSCPLKRRVYGEEWGIPWCLKAPGLGWGMASKNDDDDDDEPGVQSLSAPPAGRSSSASNEVKRLKNALKCVVRGVLRSSHRWAFVSCKDDTLVCFGAQQHIHHNVDDTNDHS